jgi:hypothetical protein
MLSGKRISMFARIGFALQNRKRGASDGCRITGTGRLTRF